MSVSLVIVSILWKALATAAVIVAAGRLAQRAGPVLTSVLITLPVNAGPGFFFIALEQETPFIHAGALTAFSVTGAVLLFCTAWVHAARFGGFLLSLAAGLAAWTAWALATEALPATLPFAFAAAGTGALLAWLLRRRGIGRPTSAAAPAGWSFVMVRGAVAGLVVASVATASPWLGPVWSGFLLAFPTTLIASAWMLYGHYGREFTAATLNAAQPSLVVYASFCLALHFLAGPLPALTAVIVAFLGAAVFAACLALVLSRRRRA
ncbi:hypothetical protein BAL199_27171 [alpha proteobacterium BAL199]|nr:hypothetical protein BAL199_27171 [alpha proteobacterium BAL199]